MGDMQCYVGSEGYWILPIHAVIAASYMRGASMFAPMFSLSFWVQSNVRLTIGKAHFLVKAGANVGHHSVGPFHTNMHC